MTRPSPPPRPKIGPFELEAPIGLGSTGRVYRALGPDGPVAIKVPKQASLRHRILLEVELLRRCRHPHLVRLVDHHPSGAWLATELVTGSTITQWSRAAPIDEIIRLGLELLAVVQHMHQQDIWHGDIHPANVLVDSWGHVKLLDLCPLPQQDHLGAPGFGAPELLEGKPASPATDVYGLGATLYAALTGHAPFEASEPSALAALPLQSIPVPPSTWRTDIPGSIDQLILSMLSREPSQRPTHAKITQVLTQSHHSKPLRPVVGMVSLRRKLRQALVTASQGGAVVVVIFGPPGSGRRTAIEDTVRQARREQLEYVGHIEPEELQRVRNSGKIPVAVSRIQRPLAIETALECLQSQTPSLLLLYGERPCAELALAGATVLTVPPLDREAVAQIATWLDVTDLDPHAVWQRTEGHPRSVWLAMERFAQRHTQDRSPFQLPVTAARILAILRKNHDVLQVDTLAELVKLPKPVLLDHCVILQACGLILAERDGRTIRASKTVKTHRT